MFHSQSTSNATTPPITPINTDIKKIALAAHDHPRLSDDEHQDQHQHQHQHQHHPLHLHLLQIKEEKIVWEALTPPRSGMESGSPISTSPLPLTRDALPASKGLSPLSSLPHRKNKTAVAVAVVDTPSALCQANPSTHARGGDKTAAKVVPLQSSQLVVRLGISDGPRDPSDLSPSAIIDTDIVSSIASASPPEDQILPPWSESFRIPPSQAITAVSLATDPTPPLHPNQVSVPPSQATTASSSPPSADRIPPPQSSQSSIPSSSITSGNIASSAIATAGASTEGKMFFGQSSLPGNAAHRRRTMANTNAITNYEADLTSRDRTKQKEAVKQFLENKIKGDWEWEWPRPTSDSLLEESPVREIHSPENIRWKERDESPSDVSDNEVEGPSQSSKPLIPAGPGSFRFESPDMVGQTVEKLEHDRKRRRRKRVKLEELTNDGLKCFNERRDAWTGARRIPPTQTIPETDDGSSTATEVEDEEWEDCELEVPIAPPLLPPSNAMRSSIKPDAYSTIYDKVILQSLTPSCPINLQDVISSCIEGWKRDGEWPPVAGPIEPTAAKKKSRKLSVANIFGFDKHERAQDKEKGPDSPIKRGFQRILSLGTKDTGRGPLSPGGAREQSLLSPSQPTSNLGIHGGFPEVAGQEEVVYTLA